ncbi:MAG: hypothetical protein HYX89_01790 [Chloroflexi bacterium]|nr:hypothetical protein [Chloroflexota bacterium]
MTRIAELQKKYSNVPKEVVVKLEVLNRGIKDNDDLDKVSVWSPPGRSYQSYDHDVTLNDLMKSGKAKDGSILRPITFYMNNGLGVRIMRDTTSPYTIREIGDGKFALFEGEEEVDIDIHFPIPKPRNREVLRTSKGTPVTELVELNRRCFMIVPVRYCEYFTRGVECKFCNFNASYDDLRSIAFDRKVTIDLEEAAEAFGIACSHIKLIEGMLESGGFSTAKQEGALYVRFVEKLATAASYKPNLKILGEAMEMQDYRRLKDAGLDCITLQMEVWDRRLFQEIVPGKAKHMPYDRWIEAFYNAVEVFGPGQVAGKFVAGATLIPENGFKSPEEALASHIEGDTFCIKNGIIPAFTPMRWAPGSPFSKDPANRDKFPPTEYLLDLAVAHHEACVKYGLYDKLNKFLYCGMDCTEYPYVGEIGMLEKAGDIGTWMADVIPYEHNWLLRFLDSLKSPAKTK